MNEVQIPLSLAVIIAGGSFSAVGVLIGVVWNQHTKRVDAIDRRVDANAAAVSAKFERLFAKMDDLNVTVAGINGAIQGLHADIAGGFVSKPDCSDHRAKGGCAPHG